MSIRRVTKKKRKIAKIPQWWSMEEVDVCLLFFTSILKLLFLGWNVTNGSGKKSRKKLETNCRKSSRTKSYTMFTTMEYGITARPSQSMAILYFDKMVILYV